MRKYKILLFVLCILLIGCSNKDNSLENTSNEIIDVAITNEPIIETPTPIPTIDPLVKVQDGDFVMYYDGTNNFMDDMNGYEKVDTVPTIYNNYETLLNHSGDYNNSAIQDFSTSYISYDCISTLENANETRYTLNDYQIKNIIPIEINGNNIVYEHEDIDEENGAYRLYSISQDENAIYYNSITKIGNQVDISSFLNKFQKQNYEDWRFFLSDMFIPILDENNNPKVTFFNNEDFVIMYLDAYMDITYFENPYKGLLIVSIDKYDGTFIYTYVGYLEDVLLNDIDDNFNKTNLLNSIVNMYHIEYIGLERKGCI